MRAKIRHADRVNLLVNLRCDDRRHQIAIINNRLVLLDHTLWKRELMLIEIGGAEPHCLKILRHWSGKSSILQLPTNLQEQYAVCRGDLPARRRVRMMSFSSSLATGVPDYYHHTAENVQRAKSIYERIRLALLYRCDYICLETYPWRLMVSTSHEMKPDLRARGTYATYCDTDSKRMDVISVGVSVRRDWTEMIWRRGWAVVESKLVLDFHGQPDDQSNSGVATVMVEVDAGRDIKFVTRNAEVASMPDTKTPFIIRWLDPCRL